jgi:hypothetical protein
VTAAVLHPESTGRANSQGSAPSNALIPAEKQHLYREVPVVVVEHEFLKMQIDEKRLYIAPLPIMSGAEDRDSEVTNPDGLIPDSYQLSRPIYFNHSHAFDPLSMPVGTCETPDHQFDLHRTKDGWSGGTLFHDQTPLAEQTFALVCRGVIRGRSIGAIDIDLGLYRPKIPMKTMREGRIVDRKVIAKSHDLYEMVEFSWTPMPSNREIVTGQNGQVDLIKSVLGLGRIGSQIIDPTLRMVLKSLDLRRPGNPVSNLEKSSHRVFTSRFDEVFSGAVTMKTPVSVLFCAKTYSLSQATALLKSDPEMFPCTDLVTDERDGQLFLRSNQLPYDGDVVIAEDGDGRFPGLQLVFAKGGFFGQSGAEQDPEEQLGQPATPATPSTTEESQAVQRIVEQAGGAVVEEGGVQQPAVGQQSPEQQSPEQQATEQAEEVETKMSGPLGAQFLQMFMQKMSDMMNEAEASTDELEPEMVAKCAEFVAKGRALAEEISGFQSERYGKQDKAPAESGTETEDEKVLLKAIRKDLFFGLRVKVPAVGLELLKQVHQSIDEDSRELLGMFVKGCVASGPPQKVAPRDDVDDLLALVRGALRK